MSFLGDSDMFGGDKFTLLACERGEGFLSHGKTPSEESIKGTNKQTTMNVPIKNGINCVECECLVATFLARRFGRLLMSVMVTLNNDKRLFVLKDREMTNSRPLSFSYGAYESLVRIWVLC